MRYLELEKIMSGYFQGIFSVAALELFHNKAKVLLQNFHQKCQIPVILLVSSVRPEYGVMGSSFPEMTDFCFRIIRDNLNAVCL